MTKQEILNLINETISGQGSMVDLASKLPEIFEAILNIIPDKAPDFNKDFNADFQSVMTREKSLALLTVTSTAESFTDGSDLDKEEAAAALGIEADELDDLMAGNYVRLAYGEDHSKILGIDIADGTSLSMGGGYLSVVLADGKYAIDVA